MRTAYCLGFFAFLHSGEFTCTAKGAWISSVLSWGDVRVNRHSQPEYLVLLLRYSKMNMFGTEVSLYVGVTGCNLCPVAAMLSYLAARPSTPGSLFVYQNDRPLSHPWLVRAVQSALASAGVDTSRYSGHSFWIGAATTAAQAGLQDSLIQTLGRWRSSAFVLHPHSTFPAFSGFSTTLALRLHFVFKEVFILLL